MTDMYEPKRQEVDDAKKNSKKIPKKKRLTNTI